MRALLLAAWALLAPLAISQEVDQRRAHFDYQMHCQGCHTPDGVGADTVPRMRDHVGVFLNSQAGREYLVRVPGSATSALDDGRLANVLNWIIDEFAGDSLSHPFTPYTAEEVGKLRRAPLNEVDDYRVQLLNALANANTGE